MPDTPLPREASHVCLLPARLHRMRAAHLADEANCAVRIVSPGDEHAGRDRARASKPATAVDHERVAVFEETQEVRDQRRVCFGLVVARRTGIGDGKGDNRQPDRTGACEQIRDTTPRTLVRFHQGDEHIRAVIPRDAFEVRAEITLPTTFRRIADHAGRDGHAKTPWQAQHLRGEKIHPDGVGLGCPCPSPPHARPFIVYRESESPTGGEIPSRYLRVRS